jgi:alpha-L-fucosidase
VDEGQLLMTQAERDRLVALTNADGKGTWWDGLDPRELNGRTHAPADPCPEFVDNFMLRVQDLIDQYNPDLLYFDDNLD